MARTSLVLTVSTALAVSRKSLPSSSKRGSPGNTLKSPINTVGRPVLSIADFNLRNDDPSRDILSRVLWNEAKTILVPSTSIVAIDALLESRPVLIEAALVSVIGYFDRMATPHQGLLLG